MRLRESAAVRLEPLMQAVGFTLWQLQELENTTSSYVAVRVREAKGIGIERGQALSAEVEKLPLGKLLAELTKAKVIGTELSSELREVLEERNWLVHRARRETRGVLSDEALFSEVMTRLDHLAEHSLQLTKRLGNEVEEYVVRSGVSRDFISGEAERLARAWGFE